MEVKVTLSARILTVTLYIVFGVGAGLLVTLPLLLDFYMRFFYDAYAILPSYRLFITIFLWLVGALCEWVIMEAILMLRTIPLGPFIHRNTRALKRVGFVIAATAALFFAKCLLYITFLTLAMGVILAVGSLIAFTLASLFRQAVEYREENDLTI